MALKERRSKTLLSSNKINIFLIPCKVKQNIFFCKVNGFCNYCKLDTIQQRIRYKCFIEIAKYMEYHIKEITVCYNTYLKNALLRFSFTNDSSKKYFFENWFFNQNEFNSPIKSE